MSDYLGITTPAAKDAGLAVISDVPKIYEPWDLSTV